VHPELHPPKHSSDLKTLWHPSFDVALYLSLNLEDATMATRGEAADYYQGAPAQGGNNGNYQMQDPKYGEHQQPPQYGQNYAPPQGPPPQGYGQPQYGEKQDFNQTFAIQGPKYHDLWAGLLVRVDNKAIEARSLTCAVHRRIPWIRGCLRHCDSGLFAHGRFQWRRYLRQPE
jgi:hypothetical protein